MAVNSVSRDGSVCADALTTSKTTTVSLRNMVAALNGVNAEFS
jgi:hypothetical protein